MSIVTIVEAGIAVGTAVLSAIQAKDQVKNAIDTTKAEKNNKPKS